MLLCHEYSRWVKVGSLTLLNAALGKALLDTFGDASWDSGLEIIDISAIDSFSECCSDDVRAYSEQLVRDLTSSEVFAVERSDEDGWVAGRVELRVDGALVEWLHLELVDGVLDNTATAGGIAGLVEDAILGNHLGLEDALGDDLELGGAGVDVGSVEAATFQKPDCHARSSADESGECLTVGGDEVSSLPSLVLQCWIVEGESELLIFWQKGESVGGSIREE